MTQWVTIVFSSILVAILLFKIYQTESLDCLITVMAITILVFTICKNVLEKAIHADYKELIELYKNNDKKREDLLEKYRKNNL